MPRADHIDATGRMDRFAELLSLDLPMPVICQRMGIGKGAAYSLVMKLRAKFGWQAQ